MFVSYPFVKPEKKTQVLSLIVIMEGKKLFL